MSHRAAFAASLLFVAAATPAWAVLPTGTLEFVQRTGTVVADATIPVVMRLTIDPGSAPLTFSNNPLDGFAPGDLPTEGQFWNPLTKQNETRPFVGELFAYLNTYYTCHGDFTNVCDPSVDYKFEFNVVDSSADPSINFRDSFTLSAGQSYEYTFGFFVPTAGGATPGVYRWNGTGVTLNFRGLDVDGNEGVAFDAMVIATGADLDANVAFERTVIAIPEPGTYALMAAGLVVVGGLARRRRAAGGTVKAPASP